MSHLRRLLVCMLVAVLAASFAMAQAGTPCQDPGGPCPDAPPPPANTNFNACLTTNPTNFNPTPFLDACTNGVPPCQSYNDTNPPGPNTVSLYGIYGNNENNSTFMSTAQAHYNLGKTIANNNFVKRCKDGSIPHGSCPEGGTGKIVFLVLGFSNCDIEICGGDSDAWDNQDTQPAGA